MKQYQKTMALLCILLCCALCLSACKTGGDSTTASRQESQDAIYTITVKTAGGMALDGLVAYVYKDNTENDLLTYGTLDSSGSYTFAAARSDGYTVRFANVPEEGYDLQPYYTITDLNTQIVLTSSVISGQDPLASGKTYKPGDVMRDFTVTTVDGAELTLSQLLQDKQAVVLNFWYTGSQSCKMELPLLQSAYGAYSDRVAVIAMNPIDITGDDAAKITAFRDTYGLTMPMATCAGQWLSAFGISSYPATVVIDRYGLVCAVSSGAVDETGVFEAVFAHFTAQDYSQQLLKDLTDLYTVEYPVGHEKNPYQTNGAAGGFAVTVEPGEEFYVQLYKDGAVTLRLEDPSAYVLYKGIRYDPNKNGVLELALDEGNVMTGETVIIGNAGVTAISLQVQVIVPQGTYSNPYEAALGSVSVTVPEGNEEGVFYQWTAAADGVLTVTVTEVPEKDYDVLLYNLASYAMASIYGDGTVDANGNPCVSLAVSAGDLVSIAYQTVPDDTGSLPQLTIGAELSFVEGGSALPEYCVTVVDGNGAPMEGVMVSLMVDGFDTVFASDAEGRIVMNLPSGIYTVKVTVPEGYACETTQFLLTAANPTKQIVMTEYVPQEVPYTVYVIDELGNPVPQAAVVLGDSFSYTDANGMVSVILLESKDHVATVLPPEGYSIAQSDHPFGAETVITVVVTTSGQAQQELDYTVQILDHNGNAYTNLLVRVDAADGSLSVTESVAADGKVKLRLPEGSYQVTLLFTAGNALGYDAASAKLTAANPNITIQVAPYIGSSSETITINGASCAATYITAGSVYADLSDGANYYYLFTPSQSGVYTFTTGNVQAAVGCWNTTDDIFNCTDSCVANNVCTLEVYTAGETYVLCVTGSADISGTVLTLTRVGDIQVEPEPEPIDPPDATDPTEPAPTTAPTVPTA